jgi:hypothetical protein
LARAPPNDSVVAARVQMGTNVFEINLLASIFFSKQLEVVIWSMTAGGRHHIKHHTPI